MRLWVDVFDASGNRLGKGPVTSLTDASITRSLDGAGSFSFSFPAADDRGLLLLQNERLVEIWAQDAVGTRLLGAGLIRKRNLIYSASQISMSVQGSDLLDELKRGNTLRGRVYDQARLDAIMDDLVALVSGWTASVEAGVAGTLINARFDGVSALKAAQKIVEQQGLHLRANGRVLEVGVFGTDTGLRVFNATRVGPGVLNNPNVLLTDRLMIGDDSDDLENWIVPEGGGDSPLTLEHSTRTSPYTIQTTTGPDGHTVYYIKDATSITSYGEIRRMVTFEDIEPPSYNLTDLQNYADMLYDAAVARLQRRKDPQRSYSFSVKNVKVSLQPGDKIDNRYKGRVYQNGVAVDIVDENASFWLRGVTESVNSSNSSVSLDIALVDRKQEGVGELVVNAIDKTRADVAVLGQNISAWQYIDSNLNIASAAASFDIQNITQEFDEWKLTAILRGDTAAIFVQILTRLNGNATAANYAAQRLFSSGTGITAARDTTNATITNAFASAATSLANAFTTITMHFTNVIDTGKLTICGADWNFIGTTIGSVQNEQGHGVFGLTSAINRIQVIPAAGNWAAGSGWLLEGKRY